MLDLLRCEFAKLRRKPLFFAAAAVSALLPLGCALFLPDFQEFTSGAEAVDGMMSTLFQMSAYLLLMPALVVLASNLIFEEQDNDTLKNLMTVPVSKPALAMAKMMLLLLFAIAFMAVGGLVILFIVLAAGWEPVGFLRLFFVGIGQGIMMWAGALPCILLVVLLNRSYIISVIVTFFYTAVNYIFSMSEIFTTQPFGLNLGTLLPGPLTFRWYFQYLDFSSPSAEMAALLERIGPYFLNTTQAFLVTGVEAVVFLALIALVYAPGRLRRSRLFGVSCKRVAEARRCQICWWALWPWPSARWHSTAPS
ncbi:MAG: ABC transporter permease [Flavonifractor plautii]